MVTLSLCLRDAIRAGEEGGGSLAGFFFLGVCVWGVRLDWLEEKAEKCTYVCVCVWSRREGEGKEQGTKLGENVCHVCVLGACVGGGEEEEGKKGHFFLPGKATQRGGSATKKSLLRSLCCCVGLVGCHFSSFATTFIPYPPPKTIGRSAGAKRTLVEEGRG